MLVFDYLVVASCMCLTEFNKGGHMKKVVQWAFSASAEECENLYLNLGLLLLRLGIGGTMLFAHGLSKLQKYGEMKDFFPDPLGLGSQLSLTFAIGAEFFCSVLLVLGFATRLVSLPLMFTMLTAFFIFHADDPWQKKELAFVYLVPFLTLFFTGPGNLSVDAKLKTKLKSADV